MRAASLVAVLAGAVGSAGLTLFAGHRNPSRVLIILFVLWVLSPFAGLLAARVMSKRWAASVRTMLYGLTLVLALGSLAIYGIVALRPPKKMAFVFLVVPLVSWLAIAVAIPAARRISRGRSPR